MQRLTVSSQYGNVDNSSQAELPEIDSISMDHRLEGGNIISNGLTLSELQSALQTDYEGIETHRTTKAPDLTEKELSSPSIIKGNKDTTHQVPKRNKKKPWLFFMLGAIACLIIGLAVGLGLGLTRKRY